jgi:F-type H+-transporting ATPase subunit delta
MKSNKAAGRYAKSLLNLATERKELDAAFKDMSAVSDVAGSVKDFRILLESKVIKPDQKLAVMDKVFGKSFSDLTMKFITIITNHNREAILADIAEAFIAQYKAQHNIIIAEVTSAVKLSDEDRKKIRRIVSEISEGEVEIEETVDPEIIGGVVIRVGDKQVDASVALRLETLKRELINKTYEAQI